MFKSSTTAAVLHRDVDRRSYIYITADANGKAGVELVYRNRFPNRTQVRKVEVY